MVAMCVAVGVSCSGCATLPWERDSEGADGATAERELVGTSRADLPDREGRPPEDMNLGEYGELEPADVPVIRVGLADGVEEARVGCDGPFTVTLLSEPVRAWESEGAGGWTFRAEGQDVEGHGDSGSFPVSHGTVRVTPGERAAIEFEGVRYRGEIEIFVQETARLAVANIVDVESYLRSVVPKEIGPRPESEIEAVKAQAVAARTYAVASSGKRAQGGFDVLSTVEDQVYAGIDAETAVCSRAVLETAGDIVVWGGEPISAYFHANCGGRTEARHEIWELPRVPYLESVWDTPGGSRNLGSAYCFQGANFTWEESWSDSEFHDVIRANLPATASTPVGGTVSQVRGLRVTERAPSGRVRWLEVETNLGRYRVFGDRVRWLLRRPGGGLLKSSWFELDVTTKGGRVSAVTAHGRGYGHGVGMCQHGAMEMAREGFSHEDILKHYYSGIEIAAEYGRPAETASPEAPHE
jgi:stage II sporulation protein D